MAETRFFFFQILCCMEKKEVLDHVQLSRRGKAQLPLTTGATINITAKPSCFC